MYDVGVIISQSTVTGTTALPGFKRPPFLPIILYIMMTLIKKEIREMSLDIDRVIEKKSLKYGALYRLELDGILACF